MNYIMLNHPQHAINLDSNGDNTGAHKFFLSLGLKFKRTHFVSVDNVEYAEMESEIDKNGQKIVSDYEINLLS